MGPSENANFKGASMELKGSAIEGGTNGNYGLFHNLDHALQAPANWNDRITSLKIIDRDGGGW